VLSLVLPSAFTTGPLGVEVGDTTVIAQAEVVNLDPQTVVYTIAPGAAWPDGTAFSAADLIRTWQQRRADRVVADLGYRQVASMTPSATGTQVTVRFSAAYSDWESLFDRIVPAATPSARCSVPTAALDPSIGPYAIVSATHQQITLQARPSWAGAAPAYRNVVVTSNPGAVPAPGASPRIVYLAAPTLAQLQAITSTGAYSSRLWHTTTVVSLDLAIQGPAALPETVRGALAQLVDRRALIERVLAPVDYTTSPEVSHLIGQGQQGYLGAPGVPVAQSTPPATPLPGATGADAYGDGANVAAADATLRSEGYAKSPLGWLTPERQRFAVCVAISADPALSQVGAELAAQLGAQGVSVRLRAEPATTAAIEAVRTGSCAAAVVSRTGDGFMTHTAANWLPPTIPVPADLTWTGVDDVTVSEDAASATAMLNPIEAQPSWNAMDARLWDFMAGLPLYSPSVYEAWSPTIAGILPANSVSGFVSQIPALLPTATKP